MPQRTTMFSGVNVGYAQENPITSHTDALELVGKTLTFIKRSGKGDQNTYETRPAYVVYDPKLQCPEGGELAVAITTDGTTASSLDTAEQLRARLQQASLAVSGSANADGSSPTTRGVHIETKGELAAIAKLWQDKASEVRDKTVSTANPYGVYASVGVYDAGDGKIVIQGEANPRYYPTDADKQAWEKAATEVASRVSSALGQTLEPSFSSPEFHYLRARDMVNSRGQAN